MSSFNDKLAQFQPLNSTKSLSRGSHGSVVLEPWLSQNGSSDKLAQFQPLNSTKSLVGYITK